MSYWCADRLCCFDRSIGNETDRHFIFVSWDEDRSDRCDGLTVIGCRGRVDRSLRCVHVAFGYFVVKQRVPIVV